MNPIANPLHNSDNTPTQTVEFVHWTQIKCPSTSLEPIMLKGVVLPTNCNLVGEKGRLGERKYRPVFYDSHYVVYKISQTLLPLIIPLVYKHYTLLTKEELSNLLVEVIETTKPIVDAFRLTGVSADEISSAAVMRRFRQLTEEQIADTVDP